MAKQQAANLLSSRPPACLLPRAAARLGQTDGQTNGRIAVSLNAPLRRRHNNPACLKPRQHGALQILYFVFLYSRATNYFCSSCYTQRWTLSVTNCTAKLVSLTSTVASFGNLVRPKTVQFITLAKRCVVRRAVAKKSGIPKFQRKYLYL